MRGEKTADADAPAHSNTEVARAGVPCCGTDFYSDTVIRDPYPFYARMRALGSVVYLTGNDLYALPRYAEVSAVLRQPLRFISSRGVSPLPRVNEILVGSTLNSDPPEHDRTRSVTSEPLLPGALKEIEPRLKDAADGLVERLVARGEFDAVADFARYLPVSIVAELVGLPDTARPDDMLKWALATFNLFGTENARTRAAFDDLEDLRDFLLEYGRPEKLKPGGWAERIFRKGAERGLYFDTCAQLTRDYINPSLDTTISTTAQLIKLLANNPDQWELIRSDPSLIPNAVEEAVRLATPIRAFTRYAAEDSEIDGHPVPKGARVLVMFASANRDPERFPDPDRFDVTRDVHDHVGFGQGVHMCMGMHLARREMILLLRALRRRVERIELLAEPDVAMNNTIRAYASMPVRVHPGETLAEDAPGEDAGDAHWLDVVIDRRRSVATDVAAFDLVAPDGADLPPFEAGSHVDVEVRSGLIRQYSLAGDPAGTGRYTIGVMLDRKSRGGSSTIHGGFDAGRRIRIGRPRNHFPLAMDARHSLLFAGGIGITPMLAMAHALDRAGLSFELHYCGRTRDKLAFREELARFGERVQIHVDSGPRGQQLDIRAVLADAGEGRHLYVCGPGGFMDFVVEAARDRGWPEARIHLERFGAEVNTDSAPFTVTARRSGVTFEVNPGESIAQKLREAGIAVRVSCQSGVCGTCLTPVLDGLPDHRDLVQTDVEKASNAAITVCCSRSKTKMLVLDI